ncbi:hypothetical protein [Streptomyces olivaceus]
MSREGSKLVCGKCGSWFEPGVVSLNPKHPCERGRHTEGKSCGGAA